MNTRIMRAAFEKSTGQTWDGWKTPEQGQERVLWVTAWNACMDSFIDRFKKPTPPLPTIEPHLLEVGK